MDEKRISLVDAPNRPQIANIARIAHPRTHRDDHFASIASPSKSGTSDCRVACQKWLSSTVLFLDRLDGTPRPEGETAAPQISNKHGDSRPVRLVKEVTTSQLSESMLAFDMIRARRKLPGLIP